MTDTMAVYCVDVIEGVNGHIYIPWLKCGKQKGLFVTKAERGRQTEQKGKTKQWLLSVITNVPSSETNLASWGECYLNAITVCLLHLYNHTIDRCPL